RFTPWPFRFEEETRQNGRDKAPETRLDAAVLSVNQGVRLKAFPAAIDHPVLTNTRFLVIEELLSPVARFAVCGDDFHNQIRWAINKRLLDDLQPIFLDENEIGHSPASRATESHSQF